MLISFVDMFLGAFNHFFSVENLGSDYCYLSAVFTIVCCSLLLACVCVTVCILAWGCIKIAESSFTKR